MASKSSSIPPCASSAPKVARKVIEKNRRNLMKSLYTHLYSLLPTPHQHHASNRKEAAIFLPDKIDEAVEYIKSLQKKLEKSQEKKEDLLMTRERANSSASGPVSADNVVAAETTSPISVPRRRLLEIHDMGPSMDVILVSGVKSIAVFYDIIRLLRQEQEERGRVEVVTATFSTNGTCVFQIIHHDKIGEPSSDFGPEGGAETLWRKLERVINGDMGISDYNKKSTKQQIRIEDDDEFWDIEIDDPALLWDFQPLLPPFGDNFYHY